MTVLNPDSATDAAPHPLPPTARSWSKLILWQNKLKQKKCQNEVLEGEEEGGSERETLTDYGVEHKRKTPGSRTLIRMPSVKSQSLIVPSSEQE